MKHSCGTVALDGLLILDSTKKKDGWELWFCSYTKHNCRSTVLSQHYNIQNCSNKQKTWYKLTP